MAVSSFSAMARPPVAGAAAAAPASLNAAMQGETAGHGAPRSDDGDLFALPLSPRSPDMKKSPFSTL